MRFSTSQIYSTLLALAAASPISNVDKRDDKIVIGYRTLNALEAKQWNEKGTPIRHAAFDRDHQIGKGVYTSPSPGEWMGQFPGNWFCVIWADKERHKDVGKMWVPETYHGVQIWDEGEQTVADYVLSASGDDYDPEKTLRMAIIGTQPDKVQMMIPKGLLGGPDVELGLTSECKSKVEELSTTESVNYDDWHDNIQGSRTDPEPEDD